MVFTPEESHRKVSLHHIYYPGLSVVPEKWNGFNGQKSESMVLTRQDKNRTIWIFSVEGLFKIKTANDRMHFQKFSFYMTGNVASTQVSKPRFSQHFKKVLCRTMQELHFQWRIYIVKLFWTPPPHLGPIFFISTQFSVKIGQTIGWRSLWEILDPPLPDFALQHDLKREKNLDELTIQSKEAQNTSTRPTWWACPSRASSFADPFSLLLSPIVLCAHKP